MALLLPDRSVNLIIALRQLECLPQFSDRLRVSHQMEMGKRKGKLWYGNEKVAVRATTLLT